MSFGERLLPLDVPVALTTGRSSDGLRAQGIHPGLADVVIGATAAVHQLTVITTNERHFKRLNVPFLTPAALLSLPHA